MGSHSRHRLILLMLVVSAAALVAACGGSANASGAASASVGGYGGYGSNVSSASSATVVSAASGPTVKLARTSKGKILVNSRGFTLYMFTADRRNVDRCIKARGCTAAWPPLTVSGRPTAGTGVNRSLLRTIRLPNGHHQVTYAGHPLYRYIGDSTPHTTYYFGVSSFGGTWYGVNAAGKAVR